MYNLFSIFFLRERERERERETTCDGELKNTTPKRMCGEDFCSMCSSGTHMP